MKKKIFSQSCCVDLSGRAGGSVGGGEKPQPSGRADKKAVSKVFDMYYKLPVAALYMAIKG